MTEASPLFPTAQPPPAESPVPQGRPRRPENLAGTIGGNLIDAARTTGAMALLFVQIVRRFFPLRIDRDELGRSMFKMAVKSVGVMVVVSLFAGAIILLQAAPMVRRYSGEALVGAFVGFATVRGVAPVLTAIIVSGRVGSNNTAELGTMVITEQFDALRALAIDPINYLIVPRFLSIVATVVLMTIYCDVIALIGAAVSSLAILGITPTSFYMSLTNTGIATATDIGVGLVKAIIFGGAIALSSCHFGLATSGGAPGVGRSVKATVVASATAVFLLDYLITFLLK